MVEDDGPKNASLLVAGNCIEEVAPRTQTRHDMVEAHVIRKPNNESARTPSLKLKQKSLTQ